MVGKLCSKTFYDYYFVSLVVRCFVGAFLSFITFVMEGGALISISKKLVSNVVFVYEVGN